MTIVAHGRYCSMRSANGVTISPERAEHHDEPAGEHCRDGECPAYGSGASVLVVETDECRKVGGLQREPARVDGGRHAGCQRERVWSVHVDRFRLWEMGRWSIGQAARSSSIHSASASPPIPPMKISTVPESSMKA
jgi:hypothetical protein